MSAKIIGRGARSECSGFLGYQDKWLNVWQHLPDPARAVNEVVLICPPIGFEYHHTYRCLRRMAEALADSGFHVLRLDYSGMGDSTGSELESGRLQDWLDQVVFLCGRARDIFAGHRLSLIGLRVGASLALRASSKVPVDKLVLWEPIVKGRSYFRELEAISALAADQDDRDESILQSAGFVMDKASAQEFKSINVQTDLAEAAFDDLLMIVGDESTAYEDWEGWTGVAGRPHQLLPMNGYAAMMDEPHKAVVPVSVIEDVVSWLSREQCAGAAGSPSHMPLLTTAVFPYSGARIEEQHHYLGRDHAMFGILTQPEVKPGGAGACFILLNSGSVHHAGPHNNYSMLARELAAAGICVFRVDLENLGDSVVTDADEENQPYQSHATENVACIVDYVRDLLPGQVIVVGGICSGAHSAFHYGVDAEEMRADKLLMINPLTFYWEPRMGLEIPSSLKLFKAQAYYKQSIRSAEKWKGLLTGKTSVSGAAGFVGRRMLLLLRNLMRDLSALGMPERTRLAKDLRSLAEGRAKVAFVFASTDPGLDIVKSDARKTLKACQKRGALRIDLIDGADHTFSRLAARTKLVRTVRQAILDW